MMIKNSGIDSRVGKDRTKRWQKAGRKWEKMRWKGRDGREGWRGGMG